MSSPSSSSRRLLLELLQEVLPVTENEATTLTERLAEWNDQMEAILFGPSCSVSSFESLSAEHDDDSVNAVSLHLQRLLLTRLLRHSESDNKEEEEGGGKNNIDWHALDTQELAVTVVAHFRGSDNDDARTCHHTAILTDDSALLKEVLRTCKNWLRWYLQIYIVIPSNTAASSTSTALQQWQSHDMLELYLLLLEQSVPEAPTVARLVSQLFFYASYDQSTVQGANDFLQHAYAFLVQDLQYFSRVLTLLVSVHNNMSNISSSDSVPTGSTGTAGSSNITTRWSALVALALSLVRNVHNILATYPSAKAAVEATTIPSTYLTVLLDLLETVTHGVTTTSAPTESFNQERQQQQDELTLEILRTFYALGVGHHLAAPIKDDRLARCLLELLKVDSSVPTLAAASSSVAAVEDSKKGSSGNVEIPLATVSVLMDASPTFSEYIVQQDAVQPVLSLLERQVTHIIETSLVDQRGAAACLPVLVVVHRFCQANMAFRKAVKEAVFPVADEANFQRLVTAKQQEIQSTRDSGATTGGAKNMKPLDAPVGTLRYKLIRLLTWPESHVKRFASEILWTLCGSDATQFILRVGMGNGMPFLGAKGMVELPQHVFS
jgi:hypothetical protein